MDNFKLQLTLPFQDILKMWAKQASPDKTLAPEIQEIKYMAALMELLRLFAQHQAEMNDASFIRAYRFFRDAGLTSRIHADIDIAKRALKLENIEPSDGKDITGI